MARQRVFAFQACPKNPPNSPSSAYFLLLVVLKLIEPPSILGDIYRFYGRRVPKMSKPPFRSMSPTPTNRYCSAEET